jgi:hypothetical protein
MALVELSVLIVPITREEYFATGLTTISALGVDTETWESGDPTRSTLYAHCVQLESADAFDVGAIKGGFLDTAEGNWLSLHAAKNYATPRREATYATCTVRFTNSSGETHEIELGDIVSVEATGKEYRVTDLPFGGTLAAPNASTLDVEVTALEAGSDSNAGVGDIDKIVSPARANVTVTNTTAATATNEESDPSLRDRARGRLDILSPNGAHGAYDYIVRTPEFNGGASVTRSRTVGNSFTGEVTVYVAGDSGAVSGGDVTLCQTAVETWCEPICIQATVTNTSNLVQAVTYELWVYDSINLTSAEVEDLVDEALAAGILARDLGGDIIPPAVTGKLYKSFLEATILRAVHPHGFRVSVTTPAADVNMAINQVATLGTVTPTIHLVEAP